MTTHRRIVQPYHQASQSSKDLADGLGCRRVRLSNHINRGVLRNHFSGHTGGRARRFVPRHGDLVINWGSSKQLFADKYYINKPSQVAVAANKLATMDTLSNTGIIGVPDYTREANVAKEWAVSDAVFCRTTLTGNSGMGIVIATSPDEIVDAKLYTRSFDMEHEVRVHVVRGGVIQFQQKRQRRGLDEPANPYVRNHGNGWVFCMNQLSVSDILIGRSKLMGILAVKALGLDFGAVDIGINNAGHLVVFEVNTAPGLTGSTLTNYVTKLGEL